MTSGSNPEGAVLVADEFDEGRSSPGDSGSLASTWVIVGVVLLLLSGLLAYTLLRRSSGPAPADVASDPLLAQGRSIYVERCVGCHGELGRGDGPLAPTLNGPPPGDLTDDDWKHGDSPDQVLGVIRQGVMGTSMPGFRGIYPDDELVGLAAYVYHLAGQEVPASYRAAAPAAVASEDTSDEEGG